MRPIKSIVHFAGNLYVRYVLHREYETQKPDPRGPNERPLEYAFALDALAISHYQDVLDVGPGLSAWPAIVAGCGYHVTAIDEISRYWDSKILNHYFYVIKDDIAAPKIRKTFGIITCLSTLEHIPTHIQAIRAMASLLKENGILVLTFPYNENRYVENVYALPGAGYGRDNPYICQVFSRSTVDAWVRETELQLVQQRYFCAFTGELWTFGQRLRPMLEVAVDEPHHLTGIIFRRNAGGQVKGAA